MNTNDEDSVRSRAKAGICYVAIGGFVCAVALLLMRAGIRTLPATARSAGPIPLEMVAGIAGIVVFLGLLQLLIALILKLRGQP